MSAALERVVRAAARRPRRVLALLAVLALAGAALALRLEPSAATDTLAGRGSDAHRATERHRAAFGDHAVVVLVRGPLPQLVLTDDLGRLIGLEGCLSGRRPRGDGGAASTTGAINGATGPTGGDAAASIPGGPGGPCAELARTRPVRVVHGPGTFINAAVGELQAGLVRRTRAGAAQARAAGRAARALARRQGRPPAERAQLARAAEQLVLAGFARDLLQLNLTYGLGLTQVPRVDDPDLVSALVFDPARGAATPKARFASLFPGPEAAVIQVRLEPDLPPAARDAAVAAVRRAVAMPEWRLRSGSYTVTGVPVLAEDLADALAGATLRLLAVAVLAMALVLAVAFRRRLRLVPLGVALAAVAICGGLMALAGAPLTMASVAVLPVLLGLAVDYAVQYQARVGEEGSARRAARRSGPAIATAALATAAGFLVLQLSPVPMVRDFGAVLVAGVAVAFGVALTGGTAALVLLARRRPGRLARAVRGAGELLALPARRGHTAVGRRDEVVGGRAGEVVGPAREVVGGRPGEVMGPAHVVTGPTLEVGRGGRALDAVLRRPGRVLVVAVALAAAGWALDTQAPVESDLRALVPPDLPAVRDLATLQAATGVAGEIDVVVEGRDLTDPAVVAWMTGYQERVLRADGAGDAGCGEAVLCPALSLPDLLRGGAADDRAGIRALLDAVPPSFSRAVITADRRTATLAFGIKNVPLDEQQAVIERMRAELDPPPGARAEIGGLPVLAAGAHAALASPWRRTGMLLAGLLAVGLVLLASYRRLKRAWVPLVPIALATGWSALLLALLGVPLNPMSATLGALVLALATEFAVLLCARFAEERGQGHSPAAAVRRAYGSTGAAVLASGATAIAGFAVLALSDIVMVRAFGIVTVVGLSASLLGVLAVLPAVLVLSERRAGSRARTPAPGAEHPVAA